MSEVLAWSIEHYLTSQGRDPVQEWIGTVTDLRSRVAIVRRIERLKRGSFGDHRFCRDGVWELRLDAGPGYRVYYALSGRTVVLLLCGGAKRTQSADIDRAVAFWQDWQGRP